MTQQLNLLGEKRNTGSTPKTEQTPDQELAHQKLKALQKDYQSWQFSGYAYETAKLFIEQVNHYKKLNPDGFSRIHQKNFKYILNSAEAQIKFYEARQNQNNSND